HFARAIDLTTLNTARGFIIQGDVAGDHAGVGDSLRAQIAERRRKERAVKDPSLIVESDLADHRLIDRVFMQNIGSGSGSRVLAGISVR
ncbi:MAG: hypothetical protein E5Y87_07230, partial [Mesorhizobium sp.]